MSETQALQQFDALKAELQVWVAPVLTLKVSDKATSDNARAALLQLKVYSKKIEERRKEITQPLRARIDEVITLAEDVGRPLLDAEKWLKSEMKTYEIAAEKRRQEERAELERKRREEDERIQAQRRKEFEVAEAKRQADQKVADDLAVQKRAEAESVAERERKKAAMFRGGKTQEQIDAERVDAEKKLEDERLAKQKAADLERAEVQARVEREDRERAKTFASQQKAVEADKSKNVRMVTQFEIEDVTKLPQRFLIPNQSEIRKAAIAGEQIPGVRIWKEADIVAR